MHSEKNLYQNPRFQKFVGRMRDICPNLIIKKTPAKAFTPPAGLCCSGDVKSGLLKGFASCHYTVQSFRKISEFLVFQVYGDDIPQPHTIHEAQP